MNRSSPSVGALQIAGWHITVHKGRHGWIALAKQEPFINGHPLLEPGDVQFACGESAIGACEQLIEEMISDGLITRKILERELTNEFGPFPE